MSTATFTIVPRRELAHRVSGGLEITLYWDVRDNTTTIEVHHAETAETGSGNCANSSGLRDQLFSGQRCAQPTAGGAIPTSRSKIPAAFATQT